MNIRQHISTHLDRVYRVLLPGGTWLFSPQLGQLLAELCKAEPVAIRATKHQAMPSCDFNRGHRKA
ncbi:MAG: hypothetical protein AB8C95_12015 [Phycisphaeraceae bacterium]